ncbi:barstar family protein [Tsukamurella sp. 8F]|uniref:barstar family protein n=1 Tax=unclassified Tsukamurella TaxID=2633480 RepID=UPI0023B9348A|nr:MULTISPECIES: barstar family protein [unclassified Tsukamurella]MDF0531832.1 barstar family protein [Tsukamurella sp. 8J]MDF0589090.1 barstar family protein [Tsukamurella sp. 8F]
MTEVTPAATVVGGSLDELRRGSPAVRAVRGSRMRTKAALLDEVSAALQFPLTFGGNWDALADCLGDLDWIAGTVVLAIAESLEVLADDEDALPVFASILADVTARPEAPLTVALHAGADDAAEVRGAWSAAGLPIAGSARR